MFSQRKLQIVSMFINKRMLKKREKVKSYCFPSKVHFSLNPNLHSKKKQCSYGIWRDFKRHEGIFEMMKIFYILIIEQLYRGTGKEMETYSTIIAWKIPWTEELGRLHSMGLQELDTACQPRHNYIYYMRLIILHIQNSQVKNVFSVKVMASSSELQVIRRKGEIEGLYNSPKKLKDQGNNTRAFS